MRKIFQKADSSIGIILSWSIVFFFITIFEEEICILASKCLTYCKFDNISTKISFVVIILLSCYLLIRRVKIFNFSLLLNAICVCIIYSLFRFNVIKHTAWDFEPFEGSIMYLDMVWMLPVIGVIPCIVKFVEKLKDNPEKIQT